MPRLERDIEIKNSQGLHARPAALFVQIVSKYNAEVAVTKDGETINGKSIMGILTLGIQQGSVIRIVADGEEAEPVMNDLAELLGKEES